MTGAPLSLRLIQIHVPVLHATEEAQCSGQDAPQSDPQEGERQRKDGRKDHGRKAVGSECTRPDVGGWSMTT